MKSKKLPRLMVVNFDGEEPVQIVRRYLAVATAKLGFEVDAVWCNEADFERLRKSLTGIKIIATSYCPPAYLQLGKCRKGGEGECKHSKRAGS